MIKLSTQNEWDILVVGGANMDYLMRGSKLPAPGEAIRSDTFQESPGGKGANQAVAASRLGAKVAFIGRVGADSRGQQILSDLQAAGVDTRYTTQDETTPTGIAIIMVDKNGNKQIFYTPGANENLSKKDVLRAAPLFEKAKVVLTQLEVPLEAITSAVQLATHGKAKIILDPAPSRALSRDFLKLIDVVRANSHEAEFLTGIPVHDRTSARLAAENLLWKGVGAAIIQAGDEGNLITWGEYELWLPKIPLKSVDTTGAGDAFSAAFATCIVENRTLPVATLFGNAAAALSTTLLGAQASFPKRETIIEFMKKIEPSKKEKTPSLRLVS